MKLEDLTDEQIIILQKVQEAAKQAGVDPSLAIAVAVQESGLNPKATSPKGAIGIMQLMPNTAKQLGVNPTDVDENIRGGVQYLKQQLDTFGDPVKALIAYNAGPNSDFFKTGKIQDLPDETLNYVSRVTAMAPIAAPEAPPEEEPGIVEQAMSGMQAAAGDAAEPIVAGVGGALAGAVLGSAIPEAPLPRPATTGLENRIVRGEAALQELLRQRAAMPTPTEMPTTPQRMPAAPAGGPVGGPVGGPAGGTFQQGAFERGIQGAPDEAFGTTGRARQETYNTETARRAAASRGVDNPFTRQTWGATPSGVLAPPEIAQQQVQRADEAQRAVQQQTAQARREQGAINKLESQIDSARRNLQLRNAELDALRSKAPGPLARAGAIFRRPLAKMIPGALTGLEALEAKNRYEQGDILGALAAAASAGGSALMAAPIPHPGVKAVGAIGAYGGPLMLMGIDELRRRGILPQVQQIDRAPAIAVGQKDAR